MEPSLNNRDVDSEGATRRHFPFLGKGELLSVCTSGWTALVNQQVIDGGGMQTRRRAPPEGPNATEMALTVGQQGERPPVSSPAQVVGMAEDVFPRSESRWRYPGSFLSWGLSWEDY